MNRMLPLIALVAFAGCSAQPDTAASAEPVTQQPVTEAPAPATSPSTSPPAVQSPLPGTAPPADAATPSPAPPQTRPGVPPRFQGTYALDGNACAQPGDESHLVVSADRIQFHESGGPIEQVHVERDTVHITAQLTGEGETRQATYAFALSSDGSQLRDVDHGMVRVRCP